MAFLLFFFFFKQKTAYVMIWWLEFRRVVFRSSPRQTKRCELPSAAVREASRAERFAWISVRTKSRIPGPGPFKSIDEPQESCTWQSNYCMGPPGGHVARSKNVSKKLKKATKHSPSRFRLYQCSRVSGCSGWIEFRNKTPRWQPRGR